MELGRGHLLHDGPGEVEELGVDVYPRGFLVLPAPFVQLRRVLALRQLLEDIGALAAELLGSAVQRDELAPADVAEVQQAPRDARVAPRELLVALVRVLDRALVQFQGIFVLAPRLQHLSVLPAYVVKLARIRRLGELQGFLPVLKVLAHLERRLGPAASKEQLLRHVVTVVAFEEDQNVPSQHVLVLYVLQSLQRHHHGRIPDEPVHTYGELDLHVRHRPVRELLPHLRHLHLRRDLPRVLQPVHVQRRDESIAASVTVRGRLRVHEGRVRGQQLRVYLPARHLARHLAEREQHRERAGHLRVRPDRLHHRPVNRHVREGVHLELRPGRHDDRVGVVNVPQDRLHGTAHVRHGVRRVGNWVIDHGDSVESDKSASGSELVRVHLDDAALHAVHLVPVLRHLGSAGEVVVHDVPRGGAVHEEISGHGRGRDVRLGELEIHALRRVVVALDDVHVDPPLAPHRRQGVVHAHLIHAAHVLALVHALRGVLQTLLGGTHSVEPSLVVHTRRHVLVPERQKHGFLVDSHRPQLVLRDVRDGHLQQGGEVRAPVAERAAQIGKRREKRVQLPIPGGHRQHLPLHGPPQARHLAVHAELQRIARVLG